jgi:hypothetical protein
LSVHNLLSCGGNNHLASFGGSLSQIIVGEK